MKWPIYLVRLDCTDVWFLNVCIVNHSAELREQEPDDITDVHIG